MKAPIRETDLKVVLSDLMTEYKASESSEFSASPDENTETGENKMSLLEVRALLLALEKPEAEQWATKDLLDAVRYLNGKSLEKVPNLHFRADQESGGVEERAGLEKVAAKIATKEVQSACMNLMKRYDIH